MKRNGTAISTYYRKGLSYCNNVKRIAFPAAAVILAIGFTSGCSKTGSFLDQTVTTSLNEKTTFADSANAIAFLNNIYTGVGLSIDPKRFGGGGLDASSDEAEGYTTSSSYTGYIQFATGSVTPSIVPNDVWSRSYGYIRSVNQFLRHLPVVPFNSALKDQTKAEARFLRAWYYSLLVQHYGGVPLLADTLYTSSDAIPAKRAAFKRCIDYIVSECDAAGAALPNTQTGSLYGRASRGACLALKTRMLLYAASPLFNNGGIGKGTALDSIVAYPDSDPNRWKAAADAASAIIALNAYQLYTDSTTVAGEKGYGFQKLFTLRYNSEYIFNWMMGDNKYLESFWDVPSRGGNGGAFPYQELVDAFPMSNGKAITEAGSGYDANNPYKNRDPRMNYTVMHDSTLRPIFGANQPSPILLYINTAVNPPVSASGDAVYKGTITGYYTYKMIDPTVINNSLSNSFRCLPLIRYADVLLMFAEAANEFSGPTTEVYQAVESVRRRAGLRPYQLTSGLSKEQMRTLIRTERRLEFAFEGQRFFDVRRWMIAEQTDNLQMHGMEVDRNPVATYKIFNVRKHNFRTAMYLWPIAQAEIAKSPELLQNPQYQ